MKNTSHIPFCHEVNLTAHPVFTGCNDEARRLLMASSACMERHEGDYFFKENDSVLGIYCITSGIIKLTRRSGKHDHIVGFLKAGDILGIDAVMMQSAHHTASAMAMTLTRGYFINRDNFLKATAADPILNIRLMQSVCEQINRLEEHITVMANKPLPQRLAQIFLMLLGDAPKESPLEISFKDAELANYARSSSPLIKKILQDFSRKDIISLRGNIIRMSNPELLKQVAT